MVERVLENSESCTIIYNTPIIFSFKEIVEAFTGRKKIRKLEGKFRLQKVVVTAGGFETRFGFQYSILGAMGDARRKVEYEGTQYPIELNENEFVSELMFTYLCRKQKYFIRIVSDSIEIRPKPRSSFLSGLIKILKDTLSPSHHIFALSAKEKMRSAKLNFLACRYRSAAHDVYYALHNIVQSLLSFRGENTKFRHGALDKILSRELHNIKTVYGVDASNVEKYSHLGKESYKLRELADYESAFEAGNALENLSNIMLRTQELLNLSTDMLTGSVAMVDGRLCVLLEEAKYERPFPTELSKSRLVEKVRILLSGLVLMENFNTHKFLLELIQQKGLYFTDIVPDFDTTVYAKYENGKYQYSLVKKAPNQGYIPLTKKNVRKWSETIRDKKVDELKFSPESIGEDFAFFYHRHFFKLHIIPDGRFYLVFNMNKKGIDKQIGALISLRNLICRVLSNISPDSFDVLFSPITILEKGKVSFISQRKSQRADYDATLVIEGGKRIFEMGGFKG